MPAFNEERVIVASLQALKRVIKREHIFVVSDGSTDRTARLAKQEDVFVLNLRKNVGKACALKRLIDRKKLSGKYRYLLFSDADSRLSPDFLKVIKKYAKSGPACIVGTVVSERHGLISAYRTYEYGMMHKVFKKAQNALDVITVAPGCASLYRSDIIKRLNFNNATLTEDFDLTIQIHKKRLGRVIYAPEAEVITQDPPTVKDYWKQIMRWYTGFWQNVFLYRLYKPTNRFNIEILIITLDSLAAIGSLAIALYHPVLLLRLIIFTYLTMVILTLIIVSIEKKFWVIWYIPFFILIYFINIAAYITSFFRAIIFRHKQLSWNKVERYRA